MPITPDTLTHRNTRDGSIVYGGPPPNSPDAWERVYVFTEHDVHARDHVVRTHAHAGQTT